MDTTPTPETLAKHPGKRLGKAPKKVDARNLKMATYFDASKLPAILPSVDWTTKVPSWTMALNDALGDCTCASAAHCIMAWTANASTMVTPTDAQILAAYEAITGYNPANPNSDQGAVELDVLKYWVNTGIGGHKIDAFMELDPRNTDHVKLAIQMFGGLYIGIQLPGNAMDTFDAGLPWNDVSDQQIEGGHAIPVLAYDADGVTVVTWGKTQKMSWAWFQKYCDEAYVCYSEDFFEKTGLTPSGFDSVTLKVDLTSLRG